MKRLRLPSEIGMLLVLCLLCAVLTAVTISKQNPVDPDSAVTLAKTIREDVPAGSRVLIVVANNNEQAAFAEAAKAQFEVDGLQVAAIVNSPSEAREQLEDSVVEQPIRAIACTGQVASYPLFRNLANLDPQLAGAKVYSPESYWWPDFIKGSNLLNITNQIAVIAIIAIGMTAVIVTAGIDLSVGSLVALAAVVSTLLIRDAAGAENASIVGVSLCFLAALLTCGAVGVFSGTMVTVFRIPPFIVTLALMLIARGAAGMLAKDQSIYQVPESFKWLGRDADILGIPNAVLLMAILYVVGHIVMTRTVWGRYIYAVGGNPEAARLSGVPNNGVLLSVYVTCALLAGLGGIVMASQLNSGRATFGTTLELYVIAAVVVGGTSLAGGRGTVFGTLIGSFIIAVIRNGMNLLGVQPNAQQIVIGLVILLAVLIDTFKNEGSPKVKRLLGAIRMGRDSGK